METSSIYSSPAPVCLVVYIRIDVFIYLFSTFLRYIYPTQSKGIMPVTGRKCSFLFSI